MKTRFADILMCALLIVCIVATVVVVQTFDKVAPVHAKSAEVPDCLAIGKAGASVVSRCEDPDMGKVCYVTTGGFMFCLDE